MNWPLLIFCFVAAWAMLHLLAGDRAARLRRLQQRLRSEHAQQIRRQSEIPVVGAPVDPPPGMHA